MLKFLNSFVSDESGASAAEYALILAIIGSAIAVAAITLGTVISNSMNKASNTIKTPATSTVPVVPVT